MRVRCLDQRAECADAWRMPIKAVFLDLDGTLINTLPDIALALNAALEKNGQAGVERARVKDYVGWGLTTTVARAMQRSESETVVQRVAADLRSWYREHPWTLSRPYPGIPELLRNLARGGIARAVWTNKDESIARAVVSGLLPGAGFCAVAGTTNAWPIKPDPARAPDICDACGVEPREVLFIGDSEVDMETAANAGFVPVGVTWGYRAASGLIAAGARHLISNPNQVFDRIHYRAIG